MTSCVAAGLVSQRRVSAGTSLWYAFGPQGETRQLTSSTGAVVDTYSYTAYGVPLSVTGTDPNPFRYGGQAGYYTDPAASGLVLCGARWFDPYGGRWLSRDPIGYEGGVNLYEYCDGNPVGALDPSGMGPLDDLGTWAQMFMGNVLACGPPGASVSANIRDVEDFLYHHQSLFGVRDPLTPFGRSGDIWRHVWFAAQVRPHGRWDYKIYDESAPDCLKRSREAFGNFNYGAVASAAGIPLEKALRCAGIPNWRKRGVLGVAQTLGPPPYGDEPKDQYWIWRGYEYHRRVYLRTGLLRPDYPDRHGRGILFRH